MWVEGWRRALRWRILARTLVDLGAPLHRPMPHVETQAPIRVTARLLPLMIGLLLALGITEAALRWLSVESPDGAISLFHAPCLPLKVPVKQVGEALRTYEADPHLVIQYDPQLGWSPRERSVSADGMYAYDSVGARAASPSAVRPESPEVVSLFGDSTMHGTGVPYADSIGAMLEQRWSGRRTVQNFAVGAYGMDQALLRWRVAHERAPARKVLFGFQAENVKRNGSIFRAFYTYETIDIPFSKPRFVEEQGVLHAINLPTLQPHELVPTLEAFSSSPLSPYEFFYQPRWYSPSPLYASRTLSFILSAIFLNNRYVVMAKEDRIYDPHGELGALALAIMRSFKEEVAATGGEFIVVHLPRRITVSQAVHDEAPRYGELLAQVKREFAVIDPLPSMVEVAAKEGAGELYVDPWHYSAKGAAIVAEAIAAKIQ